MKTLVASQVRTNMFQLIKDINKNHEEITVTSRAGDVVMLSRVDYESILETLFLLSKKGFSKDYSEAKQDKKNNRVYTMDEVFDDL